MAKLPTYTGKMSIKKGDKVIVISGRDRGKTGEVLRVMPKENRVFVQGVQMVKRHNRPSVDTQGGIDEKESSIHRSNIALVDPKTNKATRIGYRFNQQGQKMRYAKASKEIMD